MLTTEAVKPILNMSSLSSSGDKNKTDDNSSPLTNQNLTVKSFRQGADKQENLFASGNFSAKYVVNKDRTPAPLRSSSDALDRTESGKEIDRKRRSTQVDVKNSHPLTIAGGFKEVYSVPGSVSSGAHITSIKNKDVNAGIKLKGTEWDRRGSKVSHHSLLSSQISNSLTNERDEKGETVSSSFQTFDTQSINHGSLVDPRLLKSVESHLVQQSEISKQSANQKKGDTESPKPEPQFDSLQLKGGDVTRGIYKWVNNQKKAQALRRVVSSGSTISGANPLEGTTQESPLRNDDHMSVKDMLVPGGFRRSFTSERRRQRHRPREHRKKPDFLTRNFFEFLAMYGHFAGEDLEDEESEDQQEKHIHRRPIDQTGQQDYSSVSGESSDETTSLSSYEQALASDNEQALDENSSVNPNEITPLGSPSHFYTSAIATVRRGRASSPSLGTSGKIPGAIVRTDSVNKAMGITPKRKHHRRNHMKLKTLSEKKGGKTSTAKSFLLLLKAFIGTGVVFLPKSYSNGGLLFCNLLILAFSVVSYYCFVILINITRTVGVKGYGEAGKKIFGPRCQLLILISIALSQVGFASTYTVFVAENLKYLADTLGNGTYGIGLFIALQALIFIPISFTRKIGKLGVTALIADLFIFLGLLYIYFESSYHLAVNGIAETSLFKPDTWPVFIGTAVFAYEGIGLLIPIQESMSHPEKFDSILFAVIVITTIVFVTLPSLAYLSFGEKVKTVILMNFRQNAASFTIQLLYTIAILLSAPIQLFPAIKIVERYLFHKDRKKWTKKIRRESEALSSLINTNPQSYESVISPETEYRDISPTRTPPTAESAAHYVKHIVNDEGLISGKVSNKIKWLKNILRLFMVIMTCLIAYLGSSNLDRFVSLIGSFTCVPLIYVYPSMLYLKCFRKIGLISQITNYTIIITGVIMMIYTTYQTLSNW